MSRAQLHLARAKPRTGPSLSQVKKALRLFKGRGISREDRHTNARKWLVAMQSLGDRHILRKDAPAKWGVAGEPKVDQVFAPRRLGGS